jgi:hypothetical protein
LHFDKPSDGNIPICALSFCIFCGRKGIAVGIIWQKRILD